MGKEFKDQRPPCPRCGSTRINKSGIVMGKQRYLCRKCFYQYTSVRVKGKPGDTKAMALALYAYGLTQAEIGKLLNVSAVSVHAWVKELMDRNFSKPEEASLVTIPLADLLRNVPANNSGRPMVIVPIDETGEVAGLINIAAKNSDICDA